MSTVARACSTPGGGPRGFVLTLKSITRCPRPSAFNSVSCTLPCGQSGTSRSCGRTSLCTSKLPIRDLQSETCDQVHCYPQDDDQLHDADGLLYLGWDQGGAHVAQAILPGLLQSDTQRSGHGAHAPAGVGALRPAMIAPGDAPGLPCV